jgi:hypothetical protein
MSVWYFQIGTRTPFTIFNIDNNPPISLYAHDPCNCNGVVNIILSCFLSLSRKVNLSLCLLKHHAMYTYGGVEVTAPPFLISALHGDECSASRPGRVTPSTHWTGGYVSLRVGLHAVEQRKISSPCHPARSPSLYRLSYPGFYHVTFLICKTGFILTYSLYKFLSAFISFDGLI